MSPKHRLPHGSEADNVHIHPDITAIHLFRRHLEALSVRVQRLAHPHLLAHHHAV